MRKNEWIHRGKKKRDDEKPKERSDPEKAHREIKSDSKFNISSHELLKNDLGPDKKSVCDALVVMLSKRGL